MGKRREHRRDDEDADDRMPDEEPGSMPEEMFIDILRTLVERSIGPMNTSEPIDEAQILRDVEQLLGREDAVIASRILTPRHIHCLRQKSGPAFPAALRQLVEQMKNGPSVRRVGVPVDEVIESIPMRERVRVLFQVLMQSRMDPREEYKKFRELEFHKELLRALIDFADRLLTRGNVQRDIGTALTGIKQLYHPRKLRRRFDATQKNFHASLMDSITQSIHDDIQHFRVFHERLSEFFDQARATLLTAETEGNELKAATLVEDQALGFRTVVEQVRKHIDEFPRRCQHLMEEISRYHRQIAYEYCRSSADDRDPRPRSRHVDMPLDPAGNVPLFAGNLHYTAFLHGIVNNIPALSVSTAGGTKPRRGGKAKKGAERPGETQAYDPAQAENFMEFLRHQSDAHLIGNICSPRFFQQLAGIISSIHAAYKAFDSAYRSSDLESVDAAGPLGSRQAYVIRMNKELQDSSIVVQDRFRGFDPSEIIRTLGQTNMQKAPTDDEHGSAFDFQGREAKTKEQKAMLKLFGKLDAKLRAVAEGKEEMEGKSGSAFVEEAIHLKSDTQKSGRRMRRRLRKDQDDDNYTYRVEGGGPFGDLSLYQVPTEPASWEDMVGSSWKDVQKQVDVIYEFARRSHIYTDLAPRRVVKNNLLIVGPPGTGKNMGVRAIMADKRTVGIFTRVDELMSEFVGRGEKNVGHLIDGAYDLRLQHDRPAVIAIDEIDDLPAQDTEQGGGGVADRVKKSMQKAIQAVLEGHFQRDGVFLVGLTNNPERIPAPMFRRFAHVNVIEALTAKERKDLLLKLLAGIPQQRNFENIVNWDGILEQSEFASGDVLGKIMDRTYLKFLDLFEHTRPGRLDRINERLAEMKDAGKKIDARMKVRLLTDGKFAGKEHGAARLDAITFEKIAFSTLADDDVQQDMANQQTFYETVHRKIAEGFRGKGF